jgi:choline dehydrogenase-like flavoprotein
VRFGDDAKKSALDINCRAHDIDNLYVVDTSFFPSSSAVNPALTAMANALRIGDHLLERLGAHAKTSGKLSSDGQLQEVDS